MILNEELISFYKKTKQNKKTEGKIHGETGTLKNAKHCRDSVHISPDVATCR